MKSNLILIINVKKPKAPIRPTRLGYGKGALKGVRLVSLGKVSFGKVSLGKVSLGFNVNYQNSFRH